MGSFFCYRGDRGEGTARGKTPLRFANSAYSALSAEIKESPVAVRSLERTARREVQVESVLLLFTYTWTVIDKSVVGHRGSVKEPLRIIKMRMFH